MAKKKKYNPVAYVKRSKPGNYTSAYSTQLNTARNNLLNFKYDPMQDANYQALAAVYGARGNRAAKDTLGDAAALNGGMQTSYAVSAAQQARNQYNQELAALIPDLEANAYNRMQSNYSLLMDADETAYNRYRDQVADWQWGKGYDTDIYQWKLSQKKSSGGGGGGGGRSYGGGGGYSGSGGVDTGGGGGVEPSISNTKQYIVTKSASKGQQSTYNTKEKDTSGKLVTVKKKGGGGRMVI